MMTTKHVAVLMGGWSAEREVSLRSGAACAGALERRGYRVTRVDVGRDIATVLANLKPDVALNVLHGNVIVRRLEPAAQPVRHILAVTRPAVARMMPVQVMITALQATAGTPHSPSQGLDLASWLVLTNG